MVLVTLEAQRGTERDDGFLGRWLLRLVSPMNPGSGALVLVMAYHSIYCGFRRFGGLGLGVTSSAQVIYYALPTGNGESWVYPADGCGNTPIITLYIPELRVLMLGRGEHDYMCFCEVRSGLEQRGFDGGKL